MNVDSGVRVNPYVGLRPFFSEDSLYFFGRDEQTLELLEALHQSRFLAVVGSSGCGKSSLILAGLVPTLLGGFLVQDRDRWRIANARPGGSPIRNLTEAFVTALGQSGERGAVDEIERLIRETQTDALLEHVSTRLDNANLLVLIDQFEEIFAFRGDAGRDDAASMDTGRRRDLAARKAEAADFVNLLLELAARPALSIYVVLTMRTDFLGDCDLFYGLPEAMNRGQYLVPRLTRQQLRNAIEGPVRLMRAVMAPRLLDQLLNELGDRFDRLPVLQHALMRTWDTWQNDGAVGHIDQQHFSAAGGLDGALEKDAEAALVGLNQDLVARAFKGLTDTDANNRRVRRPARVSALVAASGGSRGDIEEIVQRFRENGRSFLHISSDGVPEDPRVDISHESLIRQWSRLREWVDEEREWRDAYVELANRARRRARGKAGLLRDPDLAVALAWQRDAQPTAAWASRYSDQSDFDAAMQLLQDSRSEAESAARRERRSRRRTVAAWASLAVISSLLAIWTKLEVIPTHKLDIRVTDVSYLTNQGELYMTVAFVNAGNRDAALLRVVPTIWKRREWVALAALNDTAATQPRMPLNVKARSVEAVAVSTPLTPDDAEQAVLTAFQGAFLGIRVATMNSNGTYLIQHPVARLSIDKAGRIVAAVPAIDRLLSGFADLSVGPPGDVGRASKQMPFVWADSDAAR